MKATYDNTTKTYTVSDMDAKTAHILIWGGKPEAIRKAEGALRQALVLAEDEQMPDSTYRELFA